METTAKRVSTLEERADSLEAEILHLKSILEGIYKQNVKLVKQIRDLRSQSSTS